jgi:mono/diheme cytochrome c family protein
MHGRLFVLVCITALGAVSFAGCAHGSAQAKPVTAATQLSLGDRSRGADVFRANCAVCHSATGAAAGVGPSLEHEKQRKNYDQTVAWIEQPDPPMPKLYPAALSQKDVDDVAAYVQSL